MIRQLTNVFPLAALLMSGLIASSALGEPVPLQEEEMSSVVGRGGLALFVSLSYNAQLQVGLGEDNDETYLVFDDVGGVLDLFAVGVDIKQRPDGPGSYLGISLPEFIGADNFGVGAVRIQKAGAITAPGFGGIHLNGTGSMTGQVLLWAE